MQAISPLDVYKRAAPMKVGGRYVVKSADFTRENVEVVGVPGFTLSDVALTGGTCGIRLNKCEGFRLVNLFVQGMRNPVGGSDGHGIQAINCGGLIHYCWVDALGGDIPAATPGDSEDLINIYGDEPATLQKHVIIELCHTYNRSRSDTCTHICIDGPFPPKVTVLQNRGMNSRCYITCAGGLGHDIQMNSSYGADTDIYVVDYYPTGHEKVYGIMDRITVVKNVFPKGVLLDQASRFGKLCKFQGAS